MIDRVNKIVRNLIGFMSALIGVTITFVGLIAVLLPRAIERSPETRRISVNHSNIPERFPVLVVIPGKTDKDLTARIVYYRDLGEVMSDHHGASFLVPPGRERELNWKAQRQSRSFKKPSDRDDSSHTVWDGGFKVLKGGTETQMLQVMGTWDKDWMNTGWYVAGKNSIKPVHYQKFKGPAIISSIWPLAVAGTVIIWAFLGVVVVVLRKRLVRIPGDPSR